MCWKHRAGGLLLALAMTLSLTVPAGFAAEDGQPSADESGEFAGPFRAVYQKRDGGILRSIDQLRGETEFQVGLSGPESDAGGGTVYVSLYGENGQLLRVESWPVELSGLRFQKTVRLPEDLQPDAVKLLLTDSQNRPLMPAAELDRDREPPSVQQVFSSEGATAGSDLRLVFSEPVLGVRNSGGETVLTDFLELYRQGDGEALGAALARHITLHRVGTLDLPPRDFSNEHQEDLDWIVDFRKALVEMDPSGSGEMIVTLPYSPQPVDSGLNLDGGTAYYFTLAGIQDLCGNRMVGDRGVTTLPRFETLSAAVELNTGSTAGLEDGTAVDLSFTVMPNGTESAADGERWDLLLWSDKVIEYDLYSRTREDSGGWGQWKQEGSASVDPSASGDGWAYASLMRLRNPASLFEELNSLAGEQEFALRVTKYEGSPDRDGWNGVLSMRVSVVSGSAAALRYVSLESGTQSSLEAGLAAGAKCIGVPESFTMKAVFSGRQFPMIQRGYPLVRADDTHAVLSVALDRVGSIFYIAAPVTGERRGNSAEYRCALQPSKADGAVPALREIPEVNPEAQAGAAYPDSPGYQEDHPGLELAAPGAADVMGGIAGGPDVICGSLTDISGMAADDLLDLTPDTTYLLYMVTAGENSGSVGNVTVFQFTTPSAPPPELEIIPRGSDSAVIRADRDVTLSYALVSTESLSQAASFFAAEFAGETVNEQWTEEVRRQHSSVKTVLDAMLESFGGNSRRSVFDIYASETAKAQCGAMIEQYASGMPGAAAAGREAVTAGSELSLNFQRYMNGNTRYTLLVTARAASGSDSAFRASGSYFNQVREPLKVESCILSGSGSADIASYTGELTVLFSDDPYVRIQNTAGEELFPLDACGRVSSGHLGSTSSDGYVNLGSIVDLPMNITQLTEGAHGVPVGRSLRFQLQNVPAGSVITFDSGLCGRDGEVNGAPLTIQIVCRSSGIWSAEVTSDGWRS